MYEWINNECMNECMNEWMNVECMNVWMLNVLYTMTDCRETLKRFGGFNVWFIDGLIWKV